MKLRDLIPAAEVEATVRAVVETLLEQDITVEIRGNDGDAIGTFVHKEFLCELCGEGPFKTNSALGGHKYHKHGIRANA